LPNNPNYSQNKHHWLFPAAWWKSGDHYKCLRSQCTVILPVAIHDSLHKHCSVVPLLPTYWAQEIKRQFRPTKHVLDDMEQLIELVNAELGHVHYDYIESELARLFVAALTRERRFLYHHAAQWLQ
jgi:hypothetical protein